MKDQSETVQALARASRRVVYHLMQAVVEGLKAVEAVIEEVGSIGENDDHKAETTRTRIEIE
jgi:hypothetical protein